MNYLLRAFAIVSKKYGPSSASRCARSWSPASRRSSRAASRSASATPARACVSALIGMILRGKRRYGGYLVHVGIVLMFLGFAGQRLPEGERPRSSRPGQTATIGDYTVRFDKLAHEEDRQKEMVTGELTALVDGKEIDHAAAGEVVLPQARERADHRGRDPARAGRGPLHHAGQLRPRRGDGDAQAGGQPGGQLDLVRVHAARARRPASCCLPDSGAGADDGRAPPAGGGRGAVGGCRGHRAAGWRSARAARCCWRRDRPRRRWRAAGAEAPEPGRRPTRTGWCATSSASAAPAGTT